MTSPIHTAYHTALAEISRHLPGGVPLAVDREGILRRVAREHGLSMEAARVVAALAAQAGGRE